MSVATEADIRTGVLDAMVEILAIDRSRVDDIGAMTLAEAGIDSLGVVDVVFMLEERFGIRIPFNANEQNDIGSPSTSIARLLDLVVGLIASQRAGHGAAAGA